MAHDFADTLRGVLANGNPLSAAGSKLGGAASKVGGTAAKVGGVASKAGRAGKRGGGQKSAAGTGKGRRMPVQQAADVGASLQVVYDQFTRFEDWPQFMHRVVGASQQDDCNVAMTAKIWGISREFTAAIDTQQPDERIRWSVEQGIQHTGVVTFHELAPRLTRVEVTVDVEPGSPIEKLARGARHVKRAIRGDLHRFKAFVELLEERPEGWRGTIEDGEVVRRRSGGNSGGRSRTNARGRSSGRARTSARSGRSSGERRQTSRRRR
jgi:uncharacterized membrane protein